MDTKIREKSGWEREVKNVYRTGELLAAHTRRRIQCIPVL
jgi:hypothetical protein